ncbi:MAG: N-6 DNA methylase [Phycisphaerales bacterium]|nr:N-6 DNA methylase [Phycisphaerales bacterium]
MAKRAAGAESVPVLFPEQRDSGRRRRRALFLPKYLASDAGKFAADVAAMGRARERVAAWAALEREGKLDQANERALDAEFLNEVFGDALGYGTKTSRPDDYLLDREFHVPGAGPVDGALRDRRVEGAPAGIIEMKGPAVDLDRDRSGGRTAVQQLWDYLNALPGCSWGILSNFRTIRLYHRDKTPRNYEEFSLQELLHDDRFRQFYYLFERGGLMPSVVVPEPRAIKLLGRTQKRQREVGDDLYKEYSRRRGELIHLLHKVEGKPLKTAIHAAQLLIDRVVFIAFCEDRGLLPPRTIQEVYEKVHRFSGKGARFRNFLELFRVMDEGHESLALETGYNGGLFKFDPEVDGLTLPDVPWAEFFRWLGEFDYQDEVNVEVLGHLFEKSINELERMRASGLFVPPEGEEAPGEQGSGDSPMPKSAQRKLHGIYYTPPEFTGLIVERTIDTLVNERFAEIARRHGLDPDHPDKSTPKALAAYWEDCFASLQVIRAVDPACGSGAFVIRAYESFEEHYGRIADGFVVAGMQARAREVESLAPELILSRNVYGVDLSAQAVEITRLALWIRTAQPGKTLADLSQNIIHGNSLVEDPGIHPDAMDWKAKFPTVFAAGGFDCVIGNPPWERVKVQEREFFAAHDPATAQSVSAADRKKRIARMPEKAPELFAAYTAAKADAEKMLMYARGSGRFPLTGKGDINTYMLFAELARSLVAPGGLVGLLVPSGIATDETTKEFFGTLIDEHRLAVLYDFENRKKVFPDVDGRFKFCAIVFGGNSVQFRSSEFVFFAHSVDDLHERHRRLSLTAADLKLLNPNTRTCPIFRTRRDAELTKGIYRRVPILIDHGRKKGGNPWGIRFLRMFDQTNDAKEGRFTEPSWLRSEGFKLEGNRFRKGKRVFLPLYEAKMVQAYDHRAASIVVEAGNWMRQGQKAQTTMADHQNPEFMVLPRWWVEEGVVRESLGDDERSAYVCYKDITSATNERTMIAAWAPHAAFVNSAPLMLMDRSISARRACCQLGNLNAAVLDFVARQKVGGVHLNFFIVEQLPILAPDTYDEKCPWDRKHTLEEWVSERVLRLSCTSEDMKPLASECGFKGSGGDGIHKWKDSERIEMLAELDAAFFHLYGVEREDVEYMLGTFTGMRSDEEGGDVASRARRDAVLEHFDGLGARKR